MTVEWLKPSGAIANGNANFIRNLGAITGDKQIATLEVKETIEDKTFTFRVTSGQFIDSPPSDTSVQLDVYGKQINVQDFK